MGRPKAVLCVLKLQVDEIRNLPKLNKGSGGADPYVVIEIQDADGSTVVGGDRELNCISCKTKTLKRVLEGYMLETFEFNVDTHIIRSGGIVRLTVKDFKPFPDVSKGIGFMELPLSSIAQSGGRLPMEGRPLLASGDVVNTFGKKTEHGQELRGYRDSKAPSLLHAEFEISTPAYAFMAGVPQEEQLTAWNFHMMDPEEQEEYDARLQEKRDKLLEEERAAAEAERKRVIKEKKENKLRELDKMLHHPKNARTNWKEFQDLIGNELMRREWGHTMDKYNGSGGWRRIAGAQVQDERDLDQERLLIKQWVRYKAVDREEEIEIRDYATHFNTKRLEAMTDHLRDWADFGGKYTAELNPGQRSLGASISRILPTAKLEPAKDSMKSAFEAGSAMEEEEGAFKSNYTWVHGNMGADQIAFLSDVKQEEAKREPKDDFVGFSEFKQALLDTLLQGDSRNLWRTDVEQSLQHYLGELEVVETFEGIWLSPEQQDELQQLLSEMTAEPETDPGHTADFRDLPRMETPMISRINTSELVKSLEEVVADLRGMTRPQDPDEYQQWRSECSGREKELDEAYKALERERKLAPHDRQPKREAEALQILPESASEAMTDRSSQSPMQGQRTPMSVGTPLSTTRQASNASLRVGSPLGAIDDRQSASTAASRTEGLLRGPAPSAPVAHVTQEEDGEPAAPRPGTEPRRGSLVRGMSISNLKRSKSVKFPAITPPIADFPAPRTPAAPQSPAQRLHVGREDSGSRLRLPRVSLEGTLLRTRSRSDAPTAAMSAQGLQHFEEAPAAAETTTWELEHCNGRHYLFPKHRNTTFASMRLDRQTVQQVSQGVSAADLSRESAFQTNSHDSVQPRGRTLRHSKEWHPYVPPASMRWKHTEKLQGGRICQELDLLPSLHSMSRGGSLSFATSILNPRPDTSTSQVALPAQLFHGEVEIAPDHPGGPTVYLEARYARFGPRDAFESQLVNGIPPGSADGSLAGKELVAGHAVLFDVSMKPLCLANDLCVLSARKAEEAGAVAAIFIQADDDLCAPAGGDNNIRIPVLCVRRADGLRLYNWIDPPRQFNPPYLRVKPWKPAWFAPKESQAQAEAPPQSHARNENAAPAGNAADLTSVSDRIVSFWKRIFTSDETAKEWVAEVDSTVSDHLKLSSIQALVQNTVHGTNDEWPLFSARGDSAQGEQAHGTEHKGDDDAEFRADTGTVLKMSVTQHGVVEMKTGVACIIASSTNMMPQANGESRDIPGYDDNIHTLQRLLPTLGFKVLPPLCNQNADEVRGFLRQVRKGFEKGGALSVHDSLVLILLGHSDGKSVECSMDSSGQIGSLGIQALMEFFSDLNAPGLKGKLKLFLLGLCLGHPVKEVKSLKEEFGYQRNVLNSVDTGGQASILQCAGSKRAMLKVKREWRQDADAVLRDEGDLLFTNHMSLSFRQVPYSGTLWTRPIAKASGILIIDLGLYVQGMDTFAVFQLPTIDAKCTSMNVRYCADREAAAAPMQIADWLEVVDDHGVTEFPLFDVDTGIGDPAGSVMPASRVFRVRPFSSRWIRVELSNDGSHGCLEGVGVRQLKLFCSPRSFRVPAHPPGKPTWVENPAEGAMGPALNRVGADSIWPQYVMPVYAFAGQPRALESTIGLSADYSLLCYSVPVDGVSDVKKGSMLLRAVSQLLATAHHKHTLQNLFSEQLQSLMDRWCQVEGTGKEQVRLLQRRCDEDDFPIMCSLGDTHQVSFGIRGPEAVEKNAMGTLRFRLYDKDVPEPRNADRNQSVFDRVKSQVSMPEKQYPAAFHPRLHSPYFKLSHRNVVAAKVAVSDRGVTSLGMQLSPSLKRVRWDLRVGGLEVTGRTALSVPHLRVGVVRERVIRNLALDDYVIGDDDDSWAIQTGTLTVYKCHGSGKQPERVVGARFLNGDVVTVLLDLTSKTLAFSMNDSDMVPPFTNVNSLVVPAVSAGHDTLVKVTVENCRIW